MPRKALLVSGVAAPILYVAMTLAVGLLWNGYSLRSQTPSELSALGAPTRTVWLVLGAGYAALMFAFVAVMATASAARGTRFRVYSVSTMAVVLGCGAWTATYASRLQADLPTPWVGVWERVSIGAMMAWVAVFAVTLMRSGRSTTTAVGTAVASFVRGDVSHGFEDVREAFAENLARRGERGGACCAYRYGEKVVDIWGGNRNTIAEPWEENTMVVVHSATKGLAAMALAMAHSRGWLDYDERVCAYWPEFAQQGKARITVRQLLAHQAGLFAIAERVDRTIVEGPERLAAVLARQKPAWDPGERQAYHALTLGFYEGELLRRIDPQHRTIGQFFQDEIARPLGIDLYLRLPESIPNSRLATITPPAPLAMLVGFPLRFTAVALYPRSKIHRALVVNPGTAVYLDERRIYARNLEVPSGNGVGSARAIARVFGVFASGGHELGLRNETLDLLAAPAAPSRHGFFDECLKGEVRFSLGFMKPSPSWPFGGPSAFGSPGAGGAMGFADPAAGLGYAYVTSQMGTTLTGDPREVALRRAVYAGLPHSAGAPPVAA